MGLNTPWVSFENGSQNESKEQKNKKLPLQKNRKSLDMQ
jgi:hypothetical protein